MEINASQEPAPTMEHGVSALTPPEIVAALDRYIVGQDRAKRAVAIALRNRWRRMRMPDYLQEEVIPKNILMIGPTGVGKTEIARRLAALAQAPFVKVEATKFTEVGYVGRDVESMIRDLVEVALQMLRAEKSKGLEAQARARALDKIVEKLAPGPGQKMGFTAAPDGSVTAAESQQIERVRDRVRKQLADGELDEQQIEIEVSDSGPDMLRVFSNQGMEEMGVNFQQILGNIFPQRRQKKQVKVGEAVERLAAEELNDMIDMDAITREALQRVETSGIVFIDEIDKISGKNDSASGPDVSREGVQRDILPIIEGSTVLTKHGHVKTDHILFIAAGAFHVSKPSDLIPELQGRLPIRVELDSLGVDDFKRILTEPRNALALQYVELMKTEEVTIQFTDDGVNEIAESAFAVNERNENIGARRLYTILERVVEDISFNAADIKLREVVIDADYVRDRLKDILEDRDLSRYIL